MQYFRRRRKCCAIGNMSRRGQHGSSNLLVLSRRGGGLLDLVATLAVLFSTVPLLVQSGKPKVMADSAIALHPNVTWDVPKLKYLNLGRIVACSCLLKPRTRATALQRLILNQDWNSARACAWQRNVGRASREILACLLNLHLASCYSNQP